MNSAPQTASTAGQGVLAEIVQILANSTRTKVLKNQCSHIFNVE